MRRRGSRSPVAYLESLVTASGAVRYSRTSAQTPVWVTAQALTALAGKPFPFAPVRRRARTTAARRPVKPRVVMPPVVKPRPARPARRPKAPRARMPAGLPAHAYAAGFIGAVLVDETFS